MYHQYQNPQRFQTPSIGATKRVRNENINTFRTKANQNEAINFPSTVKPTYTQQTQKRRFGTNLTNKQPLSRLPYHYHEQKQSKTLQINKPSKKISFASKNPFSTNKKENRSQKANDASFSFKFHMEPNPATQQTFADRMNNAAVNEETEPEYCPSNESWKPSVNRSFERLFRRALHMIGQYKLFIPSGKTTKIDYEIQEHFQTVPEYKASAGYLFEDDGADDRFAVFTFGPCVQHNCHVPVVDEEVHDVVLDCRVLV